MKHERRAMARRNAELTKEVEALRPKVEDLEWRLSVHEAALNAAGKANEQLQARARIAEQREAELVEALCEARSLIDSFGYSLASRVPIKCAAGVRERMNETLAKIDRLVSERES